MTWPMIMMTRLRLLFPCLMCGNIIYVQGLVINHLKNIHVVLVLACMVCRNTSWCLSPRIERITSVQVLLFQPSGRTLNLELCHDNIYCSSPQLCLFNDLTVITSTNGQSIGDRPRRWDNLTTEGDPGAAPVGQVTLKDDSYAKILKGP